MVDAMGRSHPRVSRSFRFHGTFPLAISLERNRARILALLAQSGAANPRVFGSVSRGEDGPDSDIDLLVDFRVPPSLFELAQLEADLADIIGAQVDVTPAGSLRPAMAERALNEATPL